VGGGEIVGESGLSRKRGLQLRLIKTERTTCPILTQAEVSAFSLLSFNASFPLSSTYCRGQAAKAKRISYTPLTNRSLTSKPGKAKNFRGHSRELVAVSKVCAIQGAAYPWIGPHLNKDYYTSKEKRRDHVTRNKGDSRKGEIKGVGKGEVEKT